ncbi:unnamed protein product [Symbiodinium natans]|uniref:Uncharacterized protein n=1 Tax=Symbiodinium natans TaxID=878477 RepID=A0A812LRM1_9DINO|nr:unnamed protein product [Symbiodinium natans]
MPNILLKAAGSGAEIANCTIEPLERVASLRRAAVAAGYGGPPELRCGLRLMSGSRVLRDSETLEASGLGGGGEVEVVRIPALELWRESKIVWSTIQVPVGGPLCEGAIVQQVGRDRLLAFPTRPAWRWYNEHLDESACKDHIGKYEVKRFEPSDIWLIGANEPFALQGSVQAGSGYVSARRVPLPVPDGQAIHAFHFQDQLATVLTAPGRSGEAMEGMKDGVLQKFRLCGVDADDLCAAHFQPEGPPVPFKFKFPAVTDGMDHRMEGYVPALRKFDWQEGDHSDGQAGGFTRPPYVEVPGVDRCGQLVARVCATQDEDLEQLYGEVFNFEVCELQDGGEPKQLATWRAKGCINNRCQSLGDQLMLFAGLHSGEDAFYENMQLIEWQTQHVLREIPLEFEPSYIECEWPRGILSGSTQTFFTCGMSGDYRETRFHFGAPEI